MTDESTSPLGRQQVDEALDDHRRCMQSVLELETCLDHHPDREGKWLDEIRGCLPKVAATLREHFVDEEAGPLFARVPVRHPRLAARLKVLKDEHVRMGEACERALARLEQLHDPEVYELRELNAQLQLLVATIRRHEAQENEILLEAMCDEVGVGD